TLPAIREARRELSDNSGHLEAEEQKKPFPPSWGLVDGKPFTMPLPDRKPIDKAEFEKVFPPLYSRSGINEDRASKRDAHVMQVMGSSDSPEWYTPQEIVRLS